MKTIYLVRHAKSSWDNPALPDIVRPLNSRGLAASDKMGVYLYQQGMIPQQIISSPATRALHTAINLSAGLKKDPDAIQIDERLYFEGFEALLQVIKGCPVDIQSIMLVGHEPDIGTLAEQLSGERIEKFPTCAVYMLTTHVGDWNLLSPDNCKKEVFLLPRKIFS
jgi:phosphohistidine phosphatase